MATHGETIRAIVNHERDENFAMKAGTKNSEIADGDTLANLNYFEQVSSQRL